MKNTSKKTKPFKVHIGFTATGRDRWRRFSTLTTANDFCEQTRQRTGQILTVLQSSPYASLDSYPATPLTATERDEKEKA